MNNGSYLQRWAKDGKDLLNVCTYKFLLVLYMNNNVGKRLHIIYILTNSRVMIHGTSSFYYYLLEQNIIVDKKLQSRKARKLLLLNMQPISASMK